MVVGRRKRKQRIETDRFPEANHPGVLRWRVRWGGGRLTRVAAGARKRSGTIRTGARSIVATTGGRSRSRWRAVRTTLASTCWVSAPWRVRFPPHTLRITTAGRMACSARQLVASSEGSHRKRNTAGNSVARCAAKRLASASGGGASTSRPRRAMSRPRTDARDRAARPPRPARRRSAAHGGPAPAADTANSGRPRCRSGARPGAPRAVLPGTATPRGSLRPRRRSPDRPPGPAPRGPRRPAPGADGSRGGHTRHRPAVRDAPRDLAAGPWQTVRPAGDPPACLVQLPLQALDLLLQAVVLPLQAVVLALQPFGVALAPRQLPLEPFEVGVPFRNPMRGDFRSAVVTPPL